MILPDRLVGELLRAARADRWGVTAEAFGEALARSAGHGASDGSPRDVERYLRGLHLEDLALACACAAGFEEAWDHFVREYRPILYRAGDALDPSGGGREVADSLYAELYGLRERGGARQSLFAYFHGRSTLGTWLRAVLSQRCVDRVRSGRRLEPLPGDESAAPIAAAAPEPDPDRKRLLPLVLAAVRLAIGALAPRDRLRFACYYADGLTLAETGRIVGEHEATASRQLARTRAALRHDAERHLRRDAGLADAEIARAFAYAVEDPGAFDLGRWASRKEAPDERST